MVALGDSDSLVGDNNPMKQLGPKTPQSRETLICAVLDDGGYAC